MKQRRMETLLERLADSRGHRLLVVSHCLLNENVRYLGGAFHEGAVPEVVEGIADGNIGVYQMPCPEQQAWGGVLRRVMLSAYGSKGSIRFRLRRPLLALFRWRVRLAYWQIARRVAGDLADHVRAGTSVVGILGVGPSPTCGVQRSIDLQKSVDVLGSCDPQTLDPRSLNDELFAAAVVQGEGLYIRALRKALARRDLDIPFAEHDFLAEMRGHTISPPTFGPETAPTR